MTAPQPRSDLRRSESLAFALSPVIMFLFAFPVAIGGSQLPAILGVAVVAYPLLAMSASTNRTLRRLWILTALWVVAQVASNIVHDAKMFTFQLVAGPVIAALATTLTLLNRWSYSTPKLLMISSAGWSAFSVLAIGANAGRDYWKYALALPVGLLFLSIASLRNGSTRVTVLVLITLAGISYLRDDRFYQLLYLGTALIVAFKVGRTRDRSRTRSRGGRITVALLAIVIGLGAFFAYPILARTGVLGQRAEQQQAAYDASGANFLIANRAELPQSLYIFVHHAALGVGADGALSGSDASAALQFDQSLGVGLDVNSVSYLLDSNGSQRGWATHSAAIDSGVQAGVLAIAFWIYVIWIALGALRNIRFRAPADAAILVVMVSSSVWNALFSPLVANVEIGVAITIFLAAVQHAKERDESQLDREPMSLPLGGQPSTDR